ARAVLLERHGLVTWGETSRETYEATLEFVARAARALESAGSGRFGLGGSKVRALEDDDVATVLHGSLPSLRGALLEESASLVLRVDRSPEAVAFASSADGGEVSQIGAPRPNQLINTNTTP